MINIESLVLRFDPELKLRRILRPILRSELAWRLSGLTYATAVIATTGSYGPPSLYLSDLSARMNTFDAWIRGQRSVLEFGCGLGGNLIGVGSKIERGYGVDINPHFVRIAAKLAKERALDNLTFLRYDGKTIPRLYPLDVIFTIGVFERIRRDIAIDYLSQLREMLLPSGVLIAYFLTDKAMQSGFGQVLGSTAYSPWDSSDLGQRLSQLGFRTERILPAYLGAGDIYILRVAR